MSTKINIGAILSFVFNAFYQYQADVAQLDAGGTVVTPAAVVGSRNGKPIYAKIQFSESNSPAPADTHGGIS